MDCSAYNATEYYTIPFNTNMITFHKEGSKVIHSSLGKRWFIRSDPVLWQVCNKLFSLSSSIFSAHYTFEENTSDDHPSSYYPVLVSKLGKNGIAS